MKRNHRNLSNLIILYNSRVPIEKYQTLYLNSMQDCLWKSLKIKRNSEKLTETYFTKNITEEYTKMQ